MSKRRNKKKQRKAREAQRLSGKTKIDEHYQYGPIELMRAGKHVIMKNNSTPEQHAEMLKKMKKANDEVLTELTSKIKEAQSLIKKYDPLEVMHAAGYHALGVLMEGKTESEYSTEEVKVLPSVEYLQYLIARTPQAENQQEPSEQEWKELWSKILEIFDLTQNYLISRAPKRKHADEIESLVQTLDLMRLGMRVERYQNFLEDYWRTCLLPYDDIINESYGVTAENVVAGLKELADHQQKGIMKKHLALRDSSIELRVEAAKLGLDENDPDYKERLHSSDELKELLNDAQNKATEAMTVRLFDITDVSSLPKEVLSLLSVKPGEEVLETITGPNHEDLSPLSTDLLHYKPFLEADGRFYTFYHSGFEDHMAEIIEAEIIRKKPNKQSALQKKQSDYIENLVVDLLNRVVKSDYHAVNLYYPNPDEDGLTELDGLLVADDVLILVEVKAGKISDGASRGAPDSLIDDIKNLIFEGHRQSERAERYINSGDEVSFFDKTGKNEIYSIKKKDFRCVYRVVVTREQLGWIGASLARLSELEETLNENTPWHVSLDDLMAVSELFENKSLEFLHYLDVRLEAAKMSALSQRDEIDHIALYHAMNYYYKNVESSADMMTFNAYAQKIDSYFMSKLAGENPDVPMQDMPKVLRSLVDALEKTKEKHKFEIGAFILSGDSNQRKELTKMLKRLLNNQSPKNSRSIRVALKELEAGVSFSRTSKESLEVEEIRCALMMKKQNLKRWLSVQVSVYSNQFTVEKITEYNIENYTEEQLAAAEAKLEKDIATNADSGKVARNLQCPCGSGERFKNCHGKKK